MLNDLVRKRKKQSAQETVELAEISTVALLGVCWLKMQKDTGQDQQRLRLWWISILMLLYSKNRTRTLGSGCIVQNNYRRLIAVKVMSKQGWTWTCWAYGVGGFSWLRNKVGAQGYIELDCLIVTQAVRSSVSIPSPFGLVIKDCKQTAILLQTIIFNL